MSPFLYVGLILFTFTFIFVLAYVLMKNKKEALGFDRNMKDTEIIKRFSKYAKPHVKGFVFVLVIMITSIAADLLLPLITGRIVAILQMPYFTYTDVLKCVIAYVVLLIVSLCCTYLQAVVLQKIGQKVVSSIREDVYTHIQSLSADQLNHIPVGTLVTRVANDTNAVSMMFTRVIVDLTKNVCLIVGYIVAMIVINVQLALLVMAFVPFILLFSIIFRKFSRRAYRRVKNATTGINTYLSENLSGIKITQIFNQEERKLQEFREKNNQLCRAKCGEIGVFSIFRPTIYMLYVLNVLLLFWLAGSGILKNTTFMGQVITVEVLVVFYSYISSFFTPIQNLAQQFNQLQSAFASGEKIFTILDMTPEIVDEEGAIDLDEIRGEIEFKDVWFSYLPNEWVLKGVSFTIKPGQTFALVGSTGSGKTTILSLLVRNYEIQKGQILIDGIDIKHIKISSLRKHFGQMLQDVFIFSGTIRSNIVLLEENISDEEIKRTCAYVNADSFINKMEKGLDEEVRERGNNFSAGQRQLISFARTLVHKPSVMILDEATANIDSETEILIQDSLEKMMNIGTMIIVAHRLSTVQHADKIIVLSHGEIIEEGNHQELLKLKGQYYKLYQLQYHKEQACA